MNAVISFQGRSGEVTPVKYQAMVMAIRECHQVDEIKLMRDQAMPHEYAQPRLNKPVAEWVRELAA